MLAFVSRIDSWRRGKDLSSTRLTRRPSDCGVRAPHALHGRAPATVGVAELCKALNRSSPQIDPAIDRLGQLERQDAALAIARQLIPGKRMRHHARRARRARGRGTARGCRQSRRSARHPCPRRPCRDCRARRSPERATATPCAAARRCMPISVPAPLSTITAPGCFRSEARKRRQAISLHRRGAAAEQPRRLARMRRQHWPRRGRALLFGEQIERVRIEHQRLAAGEHARQQARAPKSSVRVPGPQPRRRPPRAASRALRAARCRARSAPGGRRRSRADSRVRWRPSPDPRRRAGTPPRQAAPRRACRHHRRRSARARNRPCWPRAGATAGARDIGLAEPLEHRVETALVSGAATPKSSNSSRPACSGPSPRNSPALSATKLMVQSARTAAPMTAPLSAFSPEGRSSANTGRPQALMASMTLTSSERTAHVSPVPSSASTTRSAPASCAASHLRIGPPAACNASLAAARLALAAPPAAPRPAPWRQARPRARTAPARSRRRRCCRRR